MGTSSGYDAPTDPNWRRLKNKVTKDIKNGETFYSKAKDTLRDFIQASGGASGISSGRGPMGMGRSAQNTARRLANFISVVRSNDLQQALQFFDLGDYIGKPIDVIIFAIIDKIGGPANTINDSDARNALSSLMSELICDIDTTDELEDILNNIADEQTIEEVLSKYFGYYLYEQFCRVFYERLVKRVGRSTADSYLDNVKETIKSSLALKTYEMSLDQIDWEGDEGQSIVDNILQETFEIFGG